MDLSRELTQLRKKGERPWLTKATRDLLTQALRNLDPAFDGFFAKRARYPRFKELAGAQGVHYVLDGRLKNRYVAGSRLVLPKLGPLKLVWSRVPEVSRSW